MFDKLHEECGIFGIFGSPLNKTTSYCYYGLFAQQHRGQESAGIAISDGKQLHYYKDEGLVQDVFDSKILSFLEGHSGIGHVRYATSGGKGAVNAQPILASGITGQIALVHNGNLVNTKVLREELIAEDVNFHTSSDSEVILRMIIYYMRNGQKLVEAVKMTMSRISGGYSIILLLENRMLAFRDPHGIRPLVLGDLEGIPVLASESCAFGAIQAKLVRNILPGEILDISETGTKSHFIKPLSERFCSFEFVYFARTDSDIEGANVYETRLKMGRELYRETHIDADIVIDIPDSGTTAALGYSYESGIQFSKGFYRNSYIGRTFIKPNQDMREMGVNFKLNPIVSHVKGKRIIMVDDSIVRGTTMKRIVKSMRDAGAKEIHVMISSPAVRHSCFYGIDTPTENELIASHKTTEEICEYIAADSLHFLSIDGLGNATSHVGLERCYACFNGDYIVAPHVNHTEIVETMVQLEIL
jgi:amidophosphoribosyltransferase